MTELKFEDMTAAASGDSQNMLGKLLYFSLPSVLVDKDDLRQLCVDMNIPYAGGNRLSVSDAFRSATGDVRDRIISEEYGERRIYQIYCRDMLSRHIGRATVQAVLSSPTNQLIETQSPSTTPGKEHDDERALISDPTFEDAIIISLCTKNNYIVAQMFLCLFPRRSIRLVRKKKLTLLQRNYWRQPLNYCHCFPIGRCVFQTFHLLQTILIFLCRMLLSNLFNAQKQQMRYCYAMKAAVSNGIQQMVHRNLKIRFQNAALLILASL